VPGPWESRGDRLTLAPANRHALSEFTASPLQNFADEVEWKSQRKCRRRDVDEIVKIDVLLQIRNDLQGFPVILPSLS